MLGTLFSQKCVMSNKHSMNICDTCYKISQNNLKFQTVTNKEAGKSSNCRLLLFLDRDKKHEKWRQMLPQKIAEITAKTR